MDGAWVSSVNVVVPALLALPAASVATALTLMLPSLRLSRSVLVKTTATAVLPLPMTVLVKLCVPSLKVTTTVAPCSAVRLTTPVLAMASSAVAPPDTPVPKVNTGALGAAVSSVKLVKPALLALPPASVAMALTLMVPLVSVARSPLVKCTGTGVLPLPVTVTGTLCEPLVNVTTTVAPASAVTRTTPSLTVLTEASAAVAPLATPVPKVSTGATGAAVSTLKPALSPMAMWLSTAGLPAASLRVLPLSVKALAATLMPLASF